MICCLYYQHILKIIGTTKNKKPRRIMEYRDLSRPRRKKVQLIDNSKSLRLNMIILVRENATGEE